ncbi:zinc finger domain-containing protein [Streptomyces calvus]
MDRREIAALLAYIGRLDPRTIRTDQGEARDQLAQWHELLADVPMATQHGWDARVAARQHIRLSPYQVLPADIARPWESYRRDRLGRHTDPTPSADPDDQAAWTAELVGTRRAVATGAAQPVQYRQLAGRRIDPRLEARLKQVGSCIPPEARAALAPFRRARAAREAAIAQGQPDALSVRCEWCEAPIGEPCRRQRVAPDGFARGNAVRDKPHHCRQDLAAAQHAQEPSQPAMA